MGLNETERERHDVERWMSGEQRWMDGGVKMHKRKKKGEDIGEREKKKQVKIEIKDREIKSG